MKPPISQHLRNNSGVNPRVRSSNGKATPITCKSETYSPLRQRSVAPRPNKIKQLTNKLDTIDLRCIEMKKIASEHILMQQQLSESKKKQSVAESESVEN